MPTYDFICQNCSQRFEVFLTYSEYGKKAVHCAHCGSDQVRRRMTRVRIARSQGSRADEMESELGGLEGMEDDPKALGKMMRKMGNQMGEDLPPEFDEVVGRLESGQSPEEIEKELPELGASTGADDDLEE
jgi:putative FmdB family regulatory protein